MLGVGAQLLPADRPADTKLGQLKGEGPCYINSLPVLACVNLALRLPFVLPKETTLPAAPSQAFRPRTTFRLILYTYIQITKSPLLFLGLCKAQGSGGGVEWDGVGRGGGCSTCLLDTVTDTVPQLLPKQKWGWWKVRTGLSLGHEAPVQRGHMPCPLGETMRQTGTREGGEGKQEAKEGSHDMERGGLRATHTQAARWVSGGCLLRPAAPSTSEALQS